ncbi:MAG: tRNA lysidine(34) synthetase TilS [Lachnospiraceae bacterium]|nr:tRNA lysidine(34) synthetase TilS [Lachnospiraceae bacterium]
MDNNIASYIKDNNMLTIDDCIIAAVSGGADSMCMLFCLMELSKEIPLTLHVVHVNHGIRGKEADDDEAFVRDFCNYHSIPFSCIRADVPAIASKEGKTLEEAGREVRYKALFDIARELSASAVALAHNMNDRAETVLLNLLRGSGITGAVGIKPVTYREGIKLIRPLLSTPRTEIEEILSEAGITYRTDSTNLSDEHTRNRLRSMIFPLLTSQINSRSVNHLCSFAEDMSDLSDYVLSSARQILEDAVSGGSAAVHDNEVSISVMFLKGLHPTIVSSILRLLIAKLTISLKDISRAHIDSINALTEAETSKTVSLPYGLFALRTRDNILIGKSASLIDKAPAEPFFTCRKFTGDQVRYAHDLIAHDASDPSSNKNCTKWFDYDNISVNLRFRYPLPGDTMPVTIGGRVRHKEVAKVFREAGITAKQAQNIPIVVCENDVIWIPGIRRCDIFRVSAETQTILEITYTSVR